MEKDQIKLCPFCGATASTKYSGRCHYVECNECCAQSDFVYSEAAAIAKWNNRPPNTAMHVAACKCDPAAVGWLETLKGRICSVCGELRQ